MYPQRYVPVYLGSDFFTWSGFGVAEYSKRNAVLDQWTEPLPWQLRERAEPAVTTASDPLARKSEFRRIHGGSEKNKKKRFIENDPAHLCDITAT